MTSKPRQRNIPKQKFVARDIEISNVTLYDLYEKDVKIISKEFGIPPTVELHKDSQGVVTGFSIKLILDDWRGAFKVEIIEKVENKGTCLAVKKYRYALRPIHDENDFFRFDHDSYLDTEYPAEHINADETKYNKSHFTFPLDLDVDLQKVNIGNMITAIRYYLKNEVHPVVDRGRKYIQIIQ